MHAETLHFSGAVNIDHPNSATNSGASVQAATDGTLSFLAGADDRQVNLIFVPGISSSPSQYIDGLVGY